MHLNWGIQTSHTLWDGLALLASRQLHFFPIQVLFMYCPLKRVPPLNAFDCQDPLGGASFHFHILHFMEKKVPKCNTSLERELSPKEDNASEAVSCVFHQPMYIREKVSNFLTTPWKNCTPLPKHNGPSCPSSY